MKIISTPRNGRQIPIEQARRLLSRRLRAREAEIEAAVVARVFTIQDPAEVSDPVYAQGLRASLRTAIDYALVAVERGEERTPATPPFLLAQARMAARNEVRLETVLRRYFAGYAILTEFAIGEAEDGGLVGTGVLQRLLRGQAALFDRLIEAVSEEYAREAADRSVCAEERKARKVKQILACELLETGELNYDLTVSHVAGIGQLGDAGAGLRRLATQFGKSLLLVHPWDGRTWMWLGARSAFEQEELEELKRAAAGLLPSGGALALGQPGENLEGWRLSHRQALAAFAFADARRQPVVDYREVALRASLLGDELLAATLRESYLDPLDTGRGGGRDLKGTLRAYFECDRTISSAAAALGVRRHTVSSRLRAVEERLGLSISDCAAELEAALRLEDVQQSLYGEHSAAGPD